MEDFMERIGWPIIYTIETIVILFIIYKVCMGTVPAPCCSC